MAVGGFVIMGDYNADSLPDVDKIRMIAYGYNLFSVDDTKCDQFSTLTDKKVYKLVKKIGKNRLRILVDPADIPG